MPVPKRSEGQREDMIDLRRSMARFDDKLDASFKGVEEIKGQITNLNVRLQTHEASVRTSIVELSGKIENSRHKLELETARDKIKLMEKQKEEALTLTEVRIKETRTISELKIKDLIVWGIMGALGIFALNFGAGIIKDWLTKK